MGQNGLVLVPGKHLFAKKILTGTLNEKDLAFDDGFQSVFFFGCSVSGGVGLGLAPRGLAWLWAKVFSPPKPNAIRTPSTSADWSPGATAWLQFIRPIISTPSSF